MRTEVPLFQQDPGEQRQDPQEGSKQTHRSQRMTTRIHWSLANNELLCMTGTLRYWTNERSTAGLATQPAPRIHHSSDFLSPAPRASLTSVSWIPHSQSPSYCGRSMANQASLLPEQDH
ncbi:Dna polymerase Lambda [Manis pentadactyla]|nr:Dna polymerase Lambda [Manis pentadactyla]